MNGFLQDQLFPTIGFFLLTGVFYFSTLFGFGMIFGGFYIRILLCLIYFYQVFICAPSPKFRKFLMFLRPNDYFQNNGTIFEEDPPFDGKNNMVAFHPHGIMATLFPLNFCRSKHFQNFHFLATRGLFLIPLGGIISKWIGIEPVDPIHFESLMEKGENIAFLPGGFEEATINNHNQDQVWIKNRKGFIKYGLKYGYNLYPCYAFNETRMFCCFTWIENLRLFLNRWKFPGVLFIGKYALLPRKDLKMYTVVGKKIVLPKLEKITKEDVEKYHKIYVEKLEEMYNRYKERFESSQKLIIK